MKVSLRKDLAEEGVLVPAFDDITPSGHEIGDTYLGAKDLEDAEQIEDLCDDTHPQYNFNRIKLKDGRVFFMYGVDLDWIQE